MTGDRKLRKAEESKKEGKQTEGTREHCDPADNVGTTCREHVHKATNKCLSRSLHDVPVFCKNCSHHLRENGRRGRFKSLSASACSTLNQQLRSASSSFFSQVLKTNQFSVTRHEKVANGLIGDQGLPGVFVLYELSPMMVKFTEKHR